MVSIIMPAYNNEDTIARAIDSCLAQTYPDFELLVVENGSTDQTSRIVSRYASEDERIHLLHSPKGRSRARNVGLKAATGAYLQFLDADDELLPKKLQLSLSAFKTDPKLAAVVMATQYTDDHGQRSQAQMPAWSGDQQLLDANVFPISAVAFRNQQLTLFQESLEFNEDWQFWAFNLYGKPLKFVQVAGDVIHVEGSNTMMRRFDEMRLSEVNVRARIKHHFPARSKRLFRRDLRLASTYLILSAAHPEIKMTVTSLKFEIMLMKLAFLIPKIKRHFEFLEVQTKQRSLYG
jgi:glycosyltransferase involved in cell wall biosynthesis